MRPAEIWASRDPALTNATTGNVRTRRKRPGRRTADKRDELASPDAVHSSL